MNITILKNYNNYFNRIIKGYDTLDEYIKNVDAYYNYQTLNFNPNDGVTTTHVLNLSVDWSPDYLIVSTETGHIVSRWFVIEATRTRGKQYILNLKRDVITDYRNTLKDCPIYVENAMLKNIEDPAIYNKEDVSLNLIKTSETPLRDESLSAAVVIYIDKKTEEKIIDFKSSVNEYIDINSLPEWFPHESKLLIDSDSTFVFNGIRPGKDHYYFQETLKNDSWKCAKFQSYLKSIFIYLKADNNCDFLTIELINKGFTTSDFINKLGGVNKHSTINDYRSFNNKIVKDGSKYYKISVVINNTLNLDSKQAELMAQLINSKGPYISTFTLGSNSDAITILGNTISIIFNQISNEEVTGKIKISNNRVHTQDAQYDIIYLYFNRIHRYPSYSRDMAIDVATSIATALSNGCYDIQLMPYAPSIIFTNTSAASADELYLNLTGDEDVDYSFIKNSSGTDIGCLFYASSCQRTFNINIYKDFLDFNSRQLMDIKIANDCDMVRLSEGNYNSQFEFTPARNGTTSSFNVDITFIPHNPYIHINPVFNKLYGQDFNDMRGLVAHGDYSLPIINSAWSNYQMTNKNYQQIFNREIEHMEVEHKQDLITGILGAGASAIGMGINAGALSDSSGIGTGVGAISAGLGIADTLLNEQRYQENKSFKTDIFNLQIGNIKAMPNTISKSTPLTFNNKIFPVLEYYTCTHIEREALLSKIKYNGMKVGRIDKLSSFDKGFFRGRLIINTAIADDAHLLNDISEELTKGVYLND